MPVAYDHFEDSDKKPAPAPPYIVYKFSYSSDLMADNRNYLDISNFQVELYTVHKDLVREKLVREKLRELKLPCVKTEIYLPSEKMYQIVYEIQLIGE